MPIKRPSREITIPTHLAGPAAAFWREVQATYAIADAPGLRLLQAACEALQVAESARLVLAEQGQTYTDRFGAPRPRPEIAIQRNAMLTFSRLNKDLRLDPPTEGSK